MAVSNFGAAQIQSKIFLQQKITTKKYNKEIFTTKRYVCPTPRRISL